MEGSLCFSWLNSFLRFLNDNLVFQGDFCPGLFFWLSLSYSFFCKFNYTLLSNGQSLLKFAETSNIQGDLWLLASFNTFQKKILGLTCFSCIFIFFIFVFVFLFKDSGQRWDGTGVTHWTEAINSVPLTLTSLSSNIGAGFHTILPHLEDRPTAINKHYKLPTKSLMPKGMKKEDSTDKIISTFRW